MGFFSKLWKGVKKVVKKVARTVKKVSKKIVTSLPGGKKIWKLGTKIGKGIMKGIGKITSALGPAGMIALSFVLGPAAGALWNSFGAGAVALANSGGILASTLGTVGQGIFAAGNFISGTLGAIGEAIVGGAQNVMAGNFSQAVSTFASNMGSALTGEAGMAAVSAGNIAAMDSVLAEGPAQALSPHSSGVPSAEELFGPVGGEVPSTLADSSILPGAPTATEMFGEVGSGVVPTSTEVSQGVLGSVGTEQGTAKAIVSSMPTANEVITGTAKKSLLERTMEGVEKAKDVYEAFGGGAEGDYESQGPVLPDFVKSAIADTSAAKGGGTGSAGFSLLDPVRGLKESVRASQQMMFS